MSFNKDKCEKEACMERDEIRKKSRGIGSLLKKREDDPINMELTYSQWLSLMTKVREADYIEKIKKSISPTKPLKITNVTLYVAAESIKTSDSERGHHTWSMEALERMVARWYSDQPDGIGVVYDEYRSGDEWKPDSLKTILGIFKNVRCVEEDDLKNESAVVCDVYLFKPTDLPFFIGAALGDVNLDSKVNPSTCSLEFIRASETTMVPGFEFYMSAYLDDKLHKKDAKIAELEKCIERKTKNIKRGCLRDRYEPSDEEEECCFEDDSPCDCKEDAIISEE